ncbi:MAG: Sec-independent protein translocase protein TatB [Paracoccaceae bacterium]|nr:Sec-independent protein translocase protein TatB [Paracoccaceae bacterium]
MDIGWSELLLIGIVALIVVGPKDLPRMFAALGRFTAKARGMAREFQRAMDDAAKESGVSETAKDLRAMTSKKNLGLDKIEEAAKKFESWDPAKSGRTAAKPAPGSETAKLAEKKAADTETRREAAATAKAEPAAKAAAKPAAAPKVAAKRTAAPKAAAKPAGAKAAKAAPAKAKPAARKAKPKASNA